MFAISPVLDISWIDRRPRNPDRLMSEGWRFLPVRRQWDAAEREALAAATGLGAFSFSAAEDMDQSSLIIFLRAWLIHGDPVRAGCESEH